MSGVPTNAAVRATAKQITDDDDRALQAGETLVPADEVIEEPTATDYTAPHYLTKTAPNLARPFAALLDELRDLNARFAGELTVEVQATLSLTGEADDLEWQFLDWCRAYFATRGDLGRLSPQNGGDPWGLYCQCMDEFYELVDRRIARVGTINSSVLNLSQRYMLSHFATAVLGPDLHRGRTGGHDRYRSATTRTRARELIGRYGEQVESFSHFLRDTAVHLPDAYRPCDGDWLGRVRGQVRQCAEDLVVMRTVLCAVGVAATESQPLTPDLWARLYWDVYHGGSVAAVLTSKQPRPSGDHSTRHLLAVRRDGRLCNREYPWLHSRADDTGADELEELAVNWFLLDRLTTPYYDAWLQLDADAVVSRGMEADATAEEQTAALAVGVSEPADDDGQATATKSRRLPQLRLGRIETVLTRHFGCEWSPAKGSERKVFRPGRRMFTFGHHGADRAVSPVQLRDCLVRLGISPADFLAAAR